MALLEQVSHGDHPYFTFQIEFLIHYFSGKMLSWAFFFSSRIFLFIHKECQERVLKIRDTRTYIPQDSPR